MVASRSSTDAAAQRPALLRALPITAQIRDYLPAVSMILASGAVMVAGGYLFHAVGWSVAGLATMPAGPLISVAFALAARAGNPGYRRPPVPRARVILFLLLPTPPAELTMPKSLLVSVVTLVAGAVMAVAGYAAAAWNLLLVPPIILVGGAVISAAFLIAFGGPAPAAAVAETERLAT